MSEQLSRPAGDTPLVQINGIFAKLECTNPTGSVKDRIAAYIIEESERQGLLKPGTRIVEATSGNTGIALAWVAKQKGYPITIVMPRNMTEERKRIMRELGAELVLCSEGCFAEAAEIRDRIAAERGCFNPDQFSNPLNAECHDRTTGAELVEQLDGRMVDAFVAGVGTGGSLMGVGRHLRRINPNLLLAAVEPLESAVMSGGEPGLHGISGIGDGFIPPITGDGNGGLSPEIDEVVVVSTAEAKEACEYLQLEHGFCVGISSGANFVAATRLAKRYKTVATVFADGYGKYQSQGLKHCRAGHCPFEHDPVIS